MPEKPDARDISSKPDQSVRGPSYRLFVGWLITLVSLHVGDLRSKQRTEGDMEIGMATGRSYINKKIIPRYLWRRNIQKHVSGTQPGVGTDLVCIVPSYLGQ
jgi:hypothetical protein